MPKVKVPRKAAMTLNLTSMMDIVFQLIIFFLLISNFAAAELPKLEPPYLDKPVVIDKKDRKKVIVNVIPEGTTGQVKNLRVGGTDVAPGNYSVLTGLLQAEKDKDPEIEIDLRADGSVNYENVQPVMNAITAAGIGRINLVAFLEEKGK
ncbi:MAG: hypothetical protein GC162_20820 [Planctomycetes bacterium]|nr:hypothetical protein [Planctomycetota bacterium]